MPKLTFCLFFFVFMAISLFAVGCSSPTEQIIEDCGCSTDQQDTDPNDYENPVEQIPAPGQQIPEEGSMAVFNTESCGFGESPTEFLAVICDDFETGQFVTEFST